MQGGLTAELPRNRGFAETEIGRRGVQLELGAPVTGAVAVGNAVAVGFGDGKVRFFRPEAEPVVVEAHRGVVLCMVAAGDHVLTGGDDGRFLQIFASGDVEEIDSFGTRWVDCVAAGHERRACSSGREAHVWLAGQRYATVLKHVSTVGGLTFDATGRRLAVAHYGGATLWEHTGRRWKSSKLVWKGSHGNVTFSPDGKFLVTAMQENALHGWRLRDKNSMAMAGYPSKIGSFVWVGGTPYLATSGADEAICWPFNGKDGPMGRKPVCVAYGGDQMATCVQALPGEEVVFVGFRDGAVMMAELDETKDAFVLRGSTDAEVTAIAVSPSRSHVFVGDSKGHALWLPLRAGAGDTHARNV